TTTSSTSSRTPRAGCSRCCSRGRVRPCHTSNWDGSDGDALMTRAPAALRPADLTADVLVVGGGPAGSSLAHALARAGVDVLIVDRARFPRPKPCAEYLSPQASRVLAAMGALEDVERSGAAQLAGMVIRAPSGARIVGEFAGCAFKGFRDRGL